MVYKLLPLNTEVRILRGPKAQKIAIVVAHSDSGYVLKAKGMADTFTVSRSNVEPTRPIKTKAKKKSGAKVSPPDWPQEGWESWLP